MDDRIDILMGTYNGEKHVEEQIQSILNQTHQNFQILIGDDGSKDSTREIVAKLQQKHSDKIMLLPPTDNVGAIYNFSWMTDFIDSNYIMISDQDDVWLPHKIEVTLKKMKELEETFGTEKPLLVFTDAILVSDDLETITPSHWDYCCWDPIKSTKIGHLLVENCCYGCTLMVNKALLDLATPIPVEAGMHDYWLSLIAATFGKIGFVKEPTLKYRRHESTWSKTISPNFTWFMEQIREYDERKVQMEFRVVRSAVRAYYLYRRYSSIMSEDKTPIYEAFITLKDHSFLKELLIRLRYGFFYHSFWRTLAELYVSFKMGKLDKKYSLKL